MVWDTVRRWAGDMFGGGSSLPSNVGSSNWTSTVDAPNLGYGSFSGGSFPSNVGGLSFSDAMNLPAINYSSGGYSGFNWQDALGAAQGIINTGQNPANQGGSGYQRITAAAQPSPGQAAIGNSSFGSTIGDGYIDFGNRNPIVLPPIMAPGQSAGTRMADVGSESGGGKNKLLNTVLGAATGYAKGGPLGAIFGGASGLLG